MPKKARKTRDAASDAPEKKPKAAAKPPHPAEDEAKHPFAAEHLPECGAADGGAAIRQSYGVDRIVAMPRSPQYLFVYWELSGAESARRRARPGTRAQWVLRVHETTSSAQSDVPVDPQAGNHYLKVKPGGRYMVEMGVREGGRFHTVCASRERQLPVGEASEAAPVVWAGLRTGAAAGHHYPRPRPVPPEAAGHELGLRFDPSLLAGSSWSGTQEDQED